MKRCFPECVPQQSTSIVGVSSKGLLTAVARGTGKTLWKVKTGIVVAGGVGGGENMVLVGGDKGDVLAYDLAGKPLWSSKVSSEVLNAPAVADGVVVVRGGDSRLTALDATDGKQLWTYERATPSLVVRSHASVTIQRGIAYAGFAAGKIVALDLKNGNLIWENTVSQPRGNTELDRISDITSDVEVDDEQACAISFQGRVACFDAAQGSQLWNRDISSDKAVQASMTVMNCVFAPLRILRHCPRRTGIPRRKTRYFGAFTGRNS